MHDDGSGNTTNITKIKVYSSTANGLYPGSHIILMKRVCNDAMKVGEMLVNGKALTEPPDPYAYYKFNEVSGTTTKDFGYGANDGTASVDASNLMATGKIDRAYDFNGSSEYVNINALLTDVASDTVGSISCWVYPDTLTGSHRLWSFGDTGSDGAFYAEVDSNGRLYVRLKDAVTGYGFRAYSAAGVLATGNWYHVVVVQNGHGPKVYVNNSLLTLTYTDTTDITDWFAEMPNADNGRIACTNEGGAGNSSFFDGKIDDWRYYKYALEVDQVEQLYKIGEPDARATVYGMWEKIREVSINGPYAHFKMEDDAASTTVTDSGSGGNNGTSSTNTSNLSTTGKINDCFDFDSGSSERIDIDSVATAIASDTVGAWTFWTSPDNVSGNKRVFMISDASAESGLSFFLSDATVYFDVRNSSANYYRLQLNSGISASTWAHWVISQDGNGVKIYKNGVDITSSFTESSSGTGDSTKWHGFTTGIDVGNIGRYEWNSGSGEYWDGKLDDIRYYQRALSEREVLDIYNSGDGSQSAVANQKANSINFTGLDGDTDTVYKIIVRAYRVSGGASPVRVHLNSDDTTDAYYYAYIRGNDSTASGSQSAYYAMIWGSNTTTGETLAEGYLYARAGTIRPSILTSIDYATSTTVGQTTTFGQEWDNIGDNITNILLSHSTLTGLFDIGSRVELWRLNL